MKSNLMVYTSFVSPVTLRTFIEKELLPIPIIRHISNSKVIGKYSDTPIHFRDLAPSGDLFRRVRDKVITRDEFNREYVMEICSLDLEDIIWRLEKLTEISGAKGVVLLGYGTKPELCHRSVLRQILWRSGILLNRPEEIIWESKEEE